MKKLFMLLAAVVLTVGAYAQKTAFVNTELIFRSIPEYTKAMEDLDALAVTFQSQIDAEYDRIAEMYDRYQFQKANLSESARKEVEENIISREKQMEEKQAGYFGNDGELMKKRLELLKPIQDRVFGAIDNLSKSRNYDVVIDIANNASLVYYNQSLDISTEILRALGINK